VLARLGHEGLARIRARVDRANLGSQVALVKASDVPQFGAARVAHEVNRAGARAATPMAASRSSASRTNQPPTASCRRSGRAFDGVASAVYGKTGTADVGGQQQPNSWMVVPSWMVAFEPTLGVSIGCLVLSAGYGASVAGPQAATMPHQLAQSDG
jgi:hypothetical protein